MAGQRLHVNLIGKVWNEDWVAAPACWLSTVSPKQSLFIILLTDISSRQWNREERKYTSLSSIFFKILDIPGPRAPAQNVMVVMTVLSKCYMSTYWCISLLTLLRVAPPRWGRQQVPAHRDQSHPGGLHVGPQSPHGPPDHREVSESQHQQSDWWVLKLSEWNLENMF